MGNWSIRVYYVTMEMKPPRAAGVCQVPQSVKSVGNLCRQRRVVITWLPELLRQRWGVDRWERVV